MGFEPESNGVMTGNYFVITQNGTVGRRTRVKGGVLAQEGNPYQEAQAGGLLCWQLR